MVISTGQGDDRYDAKFTRRIEKEIEQYKKDASPFKTIKSCLLYPVNKTGFSSGLDSAAWIFKPFAIFS